MTAEPAVSRESKSRVVAVLVLVGVVGLWALARWWLVPGLIESAYRGESWDIFNRILAGRGSVPVERYLDDWYALSRTATLVLVAVGAAGWAMARFPARRKRILGWLVGGEPGLAAGGVVWLALIAGMASGLGEFAYQAVRQIITDRPAADFYAELLWMAPLSASLATLVVGSAMAGLAKLAGTGWHVAKAVGLLGFLVFYSWVQSEGIPLATWAGVVLAAGVASVVARAAASRGDGAARFVRRARPYVVGLVLMLLGYAWYILPSVAERRAVRSRPEAREGLPNIVLIILDTVRSANLGLYGYHRDTTPELGRWAQSATVFDFALATAPWTLPTHATLVTGRYNYDLRTGFRAPLADDFLTLAEALSREGYATGGFTANPHYTTAMSGLEQGFERWEDHVLDAALFFDSSWLGRTLGRRIRAPSRPYGLKDAQGVTDQLLDWLDARGDAPFFAFLNYFDAHSPYESPRDFEEFGPLPEQEWDAFAAQWQSDSTRSYGVEDVGRWVNRYDNAIRYIDHHLGRIRDYLDAQGLSDNTLVVVTADHGELWGEHGQLGHAQSLYMPSLHVPLALIFPGHVPPARVFERVSLRDVPATIMELAGLPDAGIPGRTLSGLWSASASATVVSPLVSELDRDPYNMNPWDPVSRGDMRGLTGERYHYILNGDGVEELYDLLDDPGESTDLGGRPDLADVRTGMRSALDSIVGGSTP